MIAPKKAREALSSADTTMQEDSASIARYCSSSAHSTVDGNMTNKSFNRKIGNGLC